MNICDDCGSLHATVRLTHVESNETHTFHLCEDCARDRGVPLPDGDALIKGLEAIVGGAALAETHVKMTVKPPKEGVKILAGEGYGEAAVPEPDAVCAQCGMKLSEFRSIGWLGCAGCYIGFEEHICKALLQIHGSDIHKGKRYGEVPTQRGSKRNLERLRRELDEAVNEERFEQAAVIRDTIRGLKRGVRQVAT